MIKTVLVCALAGGSAFAGWIGGSIWPAPPEWTDAVNRSANDLRAQLRLENISFDGLRQLMPSKKFDELKTELGKYAVAAGEMIEVDHEQSSLEEQLDNLALDKATAVPVDAAPAPPPAVEPIKPIITPGMTAEQKKQAEADAMKAQAEANAKAAAALAPAAAATPGGTFASALALCPRMTITNSPAHDGLAVSGYSPVVSVKGVKIATYPTKDACMSSGFGVRNDRLHKGLDYHADVGVPILAAGDGQVIEMKYRDDYGNMLLIDHGGGVYTRYAHMASFGKGLMAGVTVKAGEPIGLMGNTAGYQIPMHLHYELLVGDYNNPKGSFGLEPVNPLTFPAAK